MRKRESILGEHVKVRVVLSIYIYGDSDYMSSLEGHDFELRP